MEGAVRPVVAERQSGVFTAAQARAEGWAEHQIRYRVKKGRWVHVAGRALALPQDLPWSAVQLATAGQLTEPRLVSSHRTAALLHGFPLPPDGLSHLTGRPVHRSHRGLVVHRLPLDADEVVVVDARLMVTDRRRTALDCLGSMDLSPALDLWAYLLTRRILDPDGLRRATAARSRRRGTPRLRELLDVVSGGAASRAEYEFHLLLRQAGITGWVANADVQDGAGRIGVVDVLFPAQRVVVEIDGFRAHSGRTAFEHDRRRDARLVAAGYRVVHVTWNDLTRRPAVLLAQLRHILAA